MMQSFSFIISKIKRTPMAINKDIEDLKKYLESAHRVTETFHNVTVDYVKDTGTLYIDDAETDEQLAIFYVIEED